VPEPSDYTPATGRTSIIRRIYIWLCGETEAPLLKQQQSSGARSGTTDTSSFSSQPIPRDDIPFKKIMAANRGEIAVRVFRAGIELGLRTVSASCHQYTLITVYSTNNCTMFHFISSAQEEAVLVIRDWGWITHMQSLEACTRYAIDSSAFEPADCSMSHPVAFHCCGVGGPT
jgi:hypothetical protein